MNAKLALMLQAKAKHGYIERCSSRFSLWDCFIVQRGRLEFYYNSADGSTRMVWAALDSASLPRPLSIAPREAEGRPA